MVRSSMAKRLGAYAPWAFALLALAVLPGCSNLWHPSENPYTTIWPVSDFGRASQSLYALITYWTVGIFIVVTALMAFILIRFRDDGKPGNPKQIHGDPQLELGWTLAPVVIVIAIAIPTIRTVFEIGDAAPAGSLEVKVTGKRWWWRFDYIKEGIVTANEFHLPVGETVSLLLESDTVIHSFWVPRIGGKRDAVPGRVNRLWFKLDESEAVPGKATEYLGECAEFCGEQHARMRFRVYGHTRADYDAWVADFREPVQLADASLQQRGEAVFVDGGCAGCHVLTGNEKAIGVQGPSLTHFGSRHSIGAGAALFDPEGQMMSDEEKKKLLASWLRNPNEIKSGTTKYDPENWPGGNISRHLDGMNLPRKLTDDEVATLVDYLLAQKE